jgi:hypothetical protein
MNKNIEKNQRIQYKKKIKNMFIVKTKKKNNIIKIILKKK